MRDHITHWIASVVILRYGTSGVCKCYYVVMFFCFFNHSGSRYSKGGGGREGGRGLFLQDLSLHSLVVSLCGLSLSLWIYLDHRASPLNVDSMQESPPPLSGWASLRRVDGGSWGMLRWQHPLLPHRSKGLLLIIRT